MVNNNILFISRANDLAWRGYGNASPNPLVGALIAHNDRIIGEGWHEKYGEAHAEVNAFKSVRECDMKYLKESCLYVSLEPCNFYGKTPACTELIINKGIKRIIINSIDITDQVNGKGIEKLESNAIIVTFFPHFKNYSDPFHFRERSLNKNRSYVICKFAESADGFIGNSENQVRLTNGLTNRFTHKVRSEVDAILIGTKTALIDDPQLNIRHHPSSKKTLRIIIDNQLKLPKTAKVFNDGKPTWIINTVKEEICGAIKWICFEEHYSMNDLLTYLYKQDIGIVLLEGGAQLIQTFHDQNLIDEFYKISTPHLLTKGIRSPLVKGEFNQILNLRQDIIQHQYR